MTIEFDGQNNKLGTTTANSVTIKTNDTDALTVDSSQRIGIGTSNPTEALVVKGDGKRLTVESDDYEVAMIGRAGSSGSLLDRGYIRLRKDGVTADGVVLNTTSDSWLNGGNVGIGTSSPSQKLDVVGSIEVSDSIYLGGTGSANALDDYEEGTWTPTFTYTSTTPSFSYVTRSGRYTKIGRMVQIGFQLNVTSIDTGSAGGEIEITGLPFPCKSQSLATGVVMVYGADVYANAYDVTINVQDNSSNFRFMQSRDNEGWINMSTANDAGQLVFQSSFVYDTDS